MACVSAVNKEKAQLRWAKIDGLGSSGENVSVRFDGLPFASISLFNRGRQKSSPDVAPGPPAPYSPKRGTYAYEALQRKFKELDKDNAGHINENDLKLALKSLNLPASEQNVQGFLEGLDSGAIPFDKFAEYAVNTENSLYETFKEFDVKNRGYLTEDELKSALKKYRYRFSDKDLQALTKRETKAPSGPFDHEEVFDFSDYRKCMMAFSNKDLRDADEAWGRAIVDVGDIDTSFPVSASKKSNPPKQKLVKHAVLGAFASAVTRTLVSPLERLKLLSIADSKAAEKPLEALRTIWEDEGVQGLLRGNLINIARLVPSRLAEFLVYEKLKDTLYSRRKESEVSSLDRLLMGSFASMAGIVAGYPLDTLRTVFASQAPNKHVDDIMVKSILNKGFLNFYNGLLPSLARAVPYNFITFTIFDKLQEQYRKKVGPGGEISVPVNALFGIIAAAAAQTVVHPLEVVQRRLQVESAQQGTAVYQNVMNAFQVVLEKQGVGGLYSGLPASYAKIVPATVISLVIYKTIKEQLDEKPTPPR